MGSARVQEWLDRGAAGMDRYRRLLVVVGLLVAFVMALLGTARFVDTDGSGVRKELTLKGDVRNLYFAAAKARWRDIPRWFVGPWNSPGVGYYRPLTSILFFLEYRAFDRDFASYNRVAWLMHGLNAMLLFLLVVSLFSHCPRTRVLFGLVAVYYFATPANTLFFSVNACLTWWPAQNDVLSLTFGLLSLVLLDRYLLHSRRLLLVGALCSFAASIGAKEMGYVVMPMALALIGYRRRRPAWSMAAFVVLGVAFWILRRIVVPNPWGEHMFPPTALRKIAFYWAEPVYWAVMLHTWWTLAAAAAMIVVVAFGLRRRWPVVWIALLSLVAAGLCAQFLSEDGTWALLFIGQDQARFAAVLLYLLALLLFWRYRRTEPGLLAAALMMLVFLPILQFAGYHYLYWPGAFVALADGVFCACLVRWLWEIRGALNWSVGLSDLRIQLNRRDAEAQRKRGEESL